MSKKAMVHVRVASNTRDAFYVKAARFGSPAYVLRELIEAFVEDRVTIKPPTNRQGESLYALGE